MTISISNTFDTQAFLSYINNINSTLPGYISNSNIAIIPLSLQQLAIQSVENLNSLAGILESINDGLETPTTQIDSLETQLTNLNTQIATIGGVNSSNMQSFLNSVNQVTYNIQSLITYNAATQIALDATASLQTIIAANSANITNLQNSLNTLTGGGSNITLSNNSNELEGHTWEAPGTIGSTTPSSGAFTTLSATGGITGTLTGNVTGTASNASALENATWSVPGAIGGTTPNSGAFTTLSATGGITGNLTGNVTGNATTATTATTANNALALENATWEAPGTIGSTTPNSASFTSIVVSGTITGNVNGNLTGNVTGNATTANTASNALTLENATWESPGTIGSSAPNSGVFITLSATTGLINTSINNTGTLNYTNAFSQSFTDTNTVVQTDVLNNNVLTVTATTATETTFIGVLGDVWYNGTGGTASPGHTIGTFGFNRMNSAGQTANLMIGAEGKVTNYAGDITYALSVHGGLETVAAGSSINTWIGCHSDIDAMPGTITYAVGNALGPINITGGTITNLVGTYMLPPVLGSTEGQLSGTGTITNLIFSIMPDITGTLIPTNVYGYMSKLNYASGENKWAMWFEGTAPSYINGPVQIGSNVLQGSSALVLSGSLTTGAIQTILNISSTISPTAGVAGGYSIGCNSGITLADGSGVTYPTVYGYNSSPITKLGATDVITNFAGYHAADQTVAATTIAGFWGDISTGTGKWNLYMGGNAPNYLHGSLLIGTTTFIAGYTLEVNGSIYIAGGIVSNNPSNGIGYTSGAGSTVIQATSKATAVTLNTVTGKITTANDALAAGTLTSFVFNNSSIGANDTITVNLAGGNATIGTYLINVDGIAAGTCNIVIENRSSGSLSEALVLNFNIIKGSSN